MRTVKPWIAPPATQPGDAVLTVPRETFSFLASDAAGSRALARSSAISLRSSLVYHIATYDCLNANILANSIILRAFR